MNVFFHDFIYAQFWFKICIKFFKKIVQIDCILSLTLQAHLNPILKLSCLFFCGSYGVHLEFAFYTKLRITRFSILYHLTNVGWIVYINEQDFVSICQGHPINIDGNRVGKRWRKKRLLIMENLYVITYIQIY